MAYNIQFKRATAARIAEVPNTVLSAGEPLLDTTNDQLYIGDGVTTLSNLKPIQNTQGVLDDMVAKGLLTSTTTTATTTHNYTTDILQLDSNNSPQGFISAVDSNTAVCALSDSANGYLDFKINLAYPVTTGTISSGDFESMIQVATTDSSWGSIMITWVNNGVDTTFYKYAGDMTQTLTREGPFLYQLNSENNIVVFIDSQTTLKNVIISNNYYCNNQAVIRLTNATYESTESVTTYALNLPTATSSTLGMVKPDNNTITVDVNGVVAANIPTPATVDQTYDATSTNAQSGVAIAGAGFINGSIVQNPLQYTPANVPNYIGDITPSSPSTNWDKTYNVTNSNPIMLYTNNSAASSSYISTAEGLMSYVFNNAIKVGIQDPKNIAFTYAYELQTQGQYSDASGSIVVGYEENNTFVPVYATTNTNTYGGSVEFFTINAFNSNYGGEQQGFYYSGLHYPNVAIQIVGNTVKISRFNSSGNGADVTCSISNDTLAEINKCNIAYFSLQGRSATTYEDITNYKLCNPTDAMYNMTHTQRYAAFSSADDLLYTQIEALSLKYDSTTLGVNSNNELYALSSTPSNMVTTDTKQTITGVKKFQDNSGRYMSWSTGNLEVFGHSQEIISIHATNSSSAYVEIYKDGHYLNIGQRNATPVILTYNKEKIYRDSNYNNTPTDFLLEKDMLDGTTINYNSTSGKIEVPVDGTYIIYDSNSGKVTLDLTALKTALDAL